MEPEKPIGRSHDDLVHFLQADEDASTMVARIQSFQLKSGVPVLDEQGACRKGGVLQILSPCRCNSTLCLQTVIRFLLPSQWQGVPIQGLEGRVLFVDGDDLFDMIQLLSMLTSHLEQVLPESMHEYVHATSELVRAAVKNLTVLRVESSEGFTSALELVQQLLPEQELNVPALVVVNGVMAFYEVDCAGGLDPVFLKHPSSSQHAVRMNVTDAHSRMIAAVSALQNSAAVVMLTVDAAVQMDDSAGITCQEPLPTAWEGVVTKSLAIYETSAPDHPEPVHLARWLLPAEKRVMVLNTGSTPLALEVNA